MILFFASLFLVLASVCAVAICLCRVVETWIFTIAITAFLLFFALFLYATISFVKEDSDKPTANCGGQYTTTFVFVGKVIVPITTYHPNPCN